MKSFYESVLNAHHSICVNYSKTIFNIIIRGWLKKKKPERALKAFDFALQIAGEHPDIPLYTTMIDYYVQVKSSLNY